MRYDRKIKYLDYLENGVRVRGGGFLKTEIFRDSFKMEITVKGARGAKEFAADVILCGDGREEVLGKIQIEDGQGEFRHMCHVGAETGSMIGGTGIGCDELSGIKIPLGEGREIACTWDVPNSAVRSSAELSSGPAVKPQAEPSSGPAAKLSAELSSGSAVKLQADPPVQSTAKQQEKVRKKAAREHMPRPEQSEPRQEQSEPRQEGKAQELRETAGTHSEHTVPRREVKVWELRETAGTHSERPALHKEGKTQELRETEAARPDRKVQEQQTEAVPLLENKWLQLCAIYPHIKPFRDQREYLSIGPEDFVLFSSDSYKAACNSFMLHGYYNYRHLILTREERRGEIVYYVGVPGNYYDREKQVAIMFGFESFECAQEPAQSSDFGYYMMKVQL